VIDLRNPKDIPEHIPNVKLKKESKIADLRDEIKEVFKKMPKAIEN
jgi:hypothetical protein